MSDHSKRLAKKSANALAAGLALSRLRPQRPSYVLPEFTPDLPTYTQTHRPAKGLTSADFQATGSSYLILHPRTILADDMGLGKTKMVMDALVHISKHSNEIDTILVLCKASGLETWAGQLARFAPTAAVCLYRGDGVDARVSLLREFVGQPPGEPQFIVMTYAIFRQDFDVLKSLGQLRATQATVLDEAQDFLRSAPLNGTQSQISERIQEIDCKYKYILSGNALFVNSLADLWGPLTWLGIETRPWQQFADETLTIRQIQPDKKRQWLLRNIITGYKDEGVQRLAAMLHSCTIRRMKSDPEIAIDLPEVTIRDIDVPMSRTEAVEYRKLAKLMESGELSRDLVANKMYLATSSIQSKMEEAYAITEEAINGGEKVIVFTRHIDTLRLLYRTLDEFGLGYIHGGVSTASRRDQGESERAAMVRRFQEDPSVNVLIATPMTGGDTLTLTAGSTMIFIDRQSSPAQVKQAIDRMNRIGQTKRMNVYNLRSVIIDSKGRLKNTIEAHTEAEINKRERIGAQIIG